MSEPAHAISIPGSAPSSSSFRLDSVVSPVSITSPTSMASPFSGSSTGSLAGGAHNMFASSIATSMSSHSAASPEDDPCGINYLGKDGHGTDLATKKSKPHKCEECGASFARKVHLQRHSLRHQVCKPYSCERCNKSFSRQDSLVRHHRLLHDKTKEKRGGATSKRSKSTTRACVRCSSISVPCDGKHPCERCLSNHGGRSCVYAPTSSPVTIGAATAKSVKRSRQQARPEAKGVRHSHDEENDDVSESGSWSYGHGSRRDTVSSVDSVSWSEISSTATPNLVHTFDDLPASSWSNTDQNFSAMLSQQMQYQPTPSHPFDMPELEATSSTARGSFGDIATPQNGFSDNYHGDKSQQPAFLSLLGQMDADGHSSQQADLHHEMPTFDWTSMIHNGVENERKLPFSGSASDKTLSATLLGAENVSTFASPTGQDHMSALHSTAMSLDGNSSQQSQTSQDNIGTPIPYQMLQQQSNAGFASSGSDMVTLAALGIPLPPNVNISVPANLQMSADNWDSFMRCLASYASNHPGESISMQA